MRHGLQSWHGNVERAHKTNRLDDRPVGVADADVAAVGGEEEVRVHLAEGGEGGVVDGGKGAERSVHEVGDGRGLGHGQL